MRSRIRCASPFYADIIGQECTQNCSNFQNVSDKAIPKSTLSQHFKALREAGLIRGERRGVEMHNSSRCIEIDQRFPGLIATIVGAYQLQTAGKRRKAKKTRVSLVAGSGENTKRPQFA